jgi:short-subunit dehydrogenase
MTSYILITGAAGGLGKAFAVECASRGHDLILTDLHPQPLATLATGLRNTYRVDAQWHACDLTDAAQRAALFETLAAERRSFWALINVAGLDHEGLFRQQRIEQIRTILRLNIEGGVEMIHALLGLRDRQKTFRIINVASLAAFYPMPYKATYAASKRFLLDFSLALRAELASDDVTVTALCPAGLPTTPDCVNAIAAQGWLGQITTQNIGNVAAETLDAALRGRSVYIPGVLNRLLRVLGGLIPPALIARLINGRWKAARQRAVAPAPQPTITLVPRSA